MAQSSSPSDPSAGNASRADAAAARPLTAAQVRFLRGQAHDLKAMLQIGGKGLTDAVIAEVELALEHHELIKVKVAAEDREARDAMITALAERSGAALVQRIGHTAVLYRQSREKRQIVLPRA
ncbi:ribosome assembly RNA-binding protein YhbY [Cognatilysobacter bugurensis]|uniref:ribosome assembly RNA-binding protein YhbY n=1 Tax=Cognatilysobacter bugurensis TaxID=543356 RepID=UPI00167B8A1B|nr:ribosome assembly RNA-binding protein YhbY [Lysobacter bugurensis]